LYSAIKIDGKRAYDIARAGQTAEIKSKEIEITVFEITRIALPELILEWYVAKEPTSVHWQEIWLGTQQWCSFNSIVPYPHWRL
jgi:hypothetical protein